MITEQLGPAFVRGGTRTSCSVAVTVRIGHRSSYVRTTRGREVVESVVRSR